jgi:hypothetical protein
MTKKYHGPPYIIGLDKRSATGSLLYQLRQVANNALAADRRAGVKIDNGPKPKQTSTALRKAVGEIKESH